jgi:hypothetical protein
LNPPHEIGTYHMTRESEEFEACSNAIDGLLKDYAGAVSQNKFKDVCEAPMALEMTYWKLKQMTEGE